MNIKPHDIVEVGIGIGRVFSIEGDEAQVTYLHQLNGEPAARTFKLKDLRYLAIGRKNAECIVPDDFIDVIENRDEELIVQKEANVKRRASAGLKTPSKDKKMLNMLKELTEEQIKELFK